MNLDYTPAEPTLDNRFALGFFVYGTLKQGFGNHRLLDGYKEMGIRQASTVLPYVLEDGGFPYMVEESSDYSEDQYKQVQGEFLQVYGEGQLRLMRVLDRLEGEGSHYYRHTIQIQIKNSGLTHTHTYFKRNPRGVRPLCPVNKQDRYEWGVR